MHVIPDGVIQIKNSRVVFYNELVLKMFKITDNNTEIMTQIEEIIKQIRFPSNPESTLFETAINYEATDNCKDFLEIMVPESDLNPFMQIICKPSTIDNCCILIYLKDLSELKKYEKEKTENKYKNLLILTVSHELRTPLNNIATMITLLQPKIDPEGKQYLNMLENSYDLLMALINDILVLCTEN